MKKYVEKLSIYAVFILCALLLFTSECLAAQERVKYVDLTGKEVEVPKTVKRVCSSFPAIDEVLLLLGCPEKNVAAVESNKKNPWHLKLYPKIAELPVVFPTTNQVNMESLLQLDPDVVFVADATMRDSLIETGIPALVVAFRSERNVIDGITLIGDVLGDGAPAIAAELVKDYRDNMAMVRAKTDPIAKKDRPKVFYAADNVLNTEGAESIVTSWIEMAGGINVAAENGVKGMFIDVTLENLLEWDPDIIICRDAEHKSNYMSDARFASLSAVKNNKVFVNPKGVFVWCVRSADEVLQPVWAASVIQPELFGDIDVGAYVKAFYQKYYHYDPSEAEIENILTPTDSL
jgi:iron complex transport system substrate-binding protein